MLMIAQIVFVSQLMTDSFEHMTTTYQVLVMRIWQEKTDPSVCRFSLEDPNTGQRRGFANLSELTAYLENITTPRPINGKSIPS